MSTFLVDKVDDYEAVVGDKKLEKPDYIGFINSDKAISMLRKHICGTSPIVGHGDIDVDGIGSTYILYRFLLSQGVLNRTGFIINREKEHGIGEKHVNYFKNTSIGLLIILDSSTNELGYIKQMNCDVLVIDHHEVLHDELSGKTAGGEYVIVSNMIDNLDVNGINRLINENRGDTIEYVKPYQKEDRMSGGLVLYELLRLYQLTYNIDDVLDKMMLYQWVGITLLTDVVPLSSTRNQYYMDKTVHNMDTEIGLSLMLPELNSYQVYLDKSFISYTLAPAINRAIRAGASAEALDIVLNRPKDIRNLDVYKESQKLIMDTFMEGVKEYDTFVTKDITNTNTNISRNYCGMLATKICEETRKNTVVFIMNGNRAEGSFRGRFSGIDYRKFFEEYERGIYAQGHKTAFGFKVRIEILLDLLNKLNVIEESVDIRPYLTAGDDMPYAKRGKYHIMNMNNFKKQSLLWKLAVANSKLSSEESIGIVVMGTEAKFIEQKGSVYWYDILGLRCMSFSVLHTGQVELYTEYSREIKIYAKNIRS